MVEDTSETVEVLGVVFPKDDLAGALDAYNELGHLANNGNVVVVDDEFIDSDVAVFNLDTGDYTHASPDEIREALDIEQSFTEYVRDNVSLADHEEVNTRPDDDRAMIADGVNATVTLSTFRDIRDDDGIEIVHVKYSDYNSELQIKLQDVRGD